MRIAFVENESNDIEEIDFEEHSPHFAVGDLLSIEIQENQTRQTTIEGRVVMIEHVISVHPKDPLDYDLTVHYQKDADASTSTAGTPG